MAGVCTGCAGPAGRARPLSPAMGADDPGSWRYNAPMVHPAPHRRFVDLLLDEHQRLRNQLARAEQLCTVAEPVPAADVAALLTLRDALVELTTLARTHEPREARLLFPALRRRCPPLAPVIERMEREHAQLDAMLAELSSRLTATAGAGDGGDVDAVAGLLQQFAEASIGHMAVEESYLLPVAADYLTAEDWDEIGQATGALGS